MKICCFLQHAFVKVFVDRLKDPVFTPEERKVLGKLCSLTAAWFLENRLGDIFSGGYAAPQSKIDVMLRQGIVELCRDVKDDAVSLVDVLAPPDFVLNSPLGMSDGEVYKHLEQSIFGDRENLERPKWWREILSSSKL